MRRYLVVAHQTLGSAELLEAMKAKAAEGEAVFHVVVPMFHASGLTSTEGRDRATAQKALDEALPRMTAQGLSVTGEVGSESPVYAVDDVLRRDGHDAYVGVIVSTLPHALSKWLKLDVPSRIERGTTLPVEHLVAHRHPVGI